MGGGGDDGCSRCEHLLLNMPWCNESSDLGLFLCAHGHDMPDRCLLVVLIIVGYLLRFG